MIYYLNTADIEFNIIFSIFIFLLLNFKLGFWGFGVVVASAGKTTADGHAEAQKERIGDIRTTVIEGEHAFGLKYPIKDRTVAEAKLKVLNALEEARSQNLTGLSAVYDSARSAFTGGPSKLDSARAAKIEYFETLLPAAPTAKSGHSFASTPIIKDSGNAAESIKEYSLIDFVYSWLF